MKKLLIVFILMFSTNVFGITIDKVMVGGVIYKGSSCIIKDQLYFDAKVLNSSGYKWSVTKGVVKVNGKTFTLTKGKFIKWDKLFKHYIFNKKQGCYNFYDWKLK